MQAMVIRLLLAVLALGFCASPAPAQFAQTTGVGGGLPGSIVTNGPGFDSLVGYR